MVTTTTPAAELVTHSPLSKRYWVDMAMLQLSIVWLTDWAPRTLPLILMAIVSGSVYALWAWKLLGTDRRLTPRLLLAASVMIPLAVYLTAPRFHFATDLLQVLLLVSAGFASMAAGKPARRPAPPAAE